MKLVDEHLEHLPLILEDGDVSITLLLNFLLEIERQRLLVQLSYQCEALELLISCRTILVDLVLHDARNESNLLRIVLGSGQFHGESQ